jgi:hypothetical protein
VSAAYYQCERLKALIYDPPPSVLVLVSADANHVTVAAQLRALADQIERGPGPLHPALMSDDGPPMTAYVSEVDGSAELRLSREQAD